MFDPSKFVNTRARLQRLRDAKFFSGWISDFGATELKVRLAGALMPDPGDTLMVEGFGSEQVVSFRAIVRLVLEDMVDLTVEPPMRFRANGESARVAVSNVSGWLTHNGNDFEVQVQDVSASGAGLILHSQLDRKATVQLRLATPAGEIVCEGEVRYCRVDSADAGTFRAGIQLGEMGRIERARWNVLLGGMAA